MKKIVLYAAFIAVWVFIVNEIFLFLWYVAPYKIEENNPYETIKEALENYEERIIIVSKNEKNIWDCFQESKNASKYSTVNVEIVMKEINSMLNFTNVKFSIAEFNYNSDFKIMKAAENSSYISKLDENEMKIFQHLNDKVSELIEENMTDEEKIKAIHDYIILEYEYRVFDVAPEELPAEYFSISGMIENGKGVCEAYGDMFRTMCLIAGLECEEVTGEANGNSHMWNIINIGGEYRHFDVTFDDPVPDVKGRILYNYFNISEEEMREMRGSYQIVCN